MLQKKTHKGIILGEWSWVSIWVLIQENTVYIKPVKFYSLQL